MHLSGTTDKDIQVNNYGDCQHVRTCQKTTKELATRLGQPYGELNEGSGERVDLCHHVSRLINNPIEVVAPASLSAAVKEYSNTATSVEGVDVS